MSPLEAGAPAFQPKETPVINNAEQMQPQESLGQQINDTWQKVPEIIAGHPDNQFLNTPGYTPNKGALPEPEFNRQIALVGARNIISHDIRINGIAQSEFDEKVSAWRQQNTGQDLPFEVQKKINAEVYQKYFAPNGDPYLVGADGKITKQTIPYHHAIGVMMDELTSIADRGGPGSVQAREILNKFHYSKEQRAFIVGKENLNDSLQSQIKYQLQKGLDNPPESLKLNFLTDEMIAQQATEEAGVFKPDPKLDATRLAVQQHEYDKKVEEYITRITNERTEAMKAASPDGNVKAIQDREAKVQSDRAKVQKIIDTVQPDGTDGQGHSLLKEIDGLLTQIGGEADKLKDEIGKAKKIKKVTQVKTDPNAPQMEYWLTKEQYVKETVDEALAENDRHPTKSAEQVRTETEKIASANFEDRAILHSEDTGEKGELTPEKEIAEIAPILLNASGALAVPEIMENHDAEIVNTAVSLQKQIEFAYVARHDFPYINLFLKRQALTATQEFFTKYGSRIRNSDFSTYLTPEITELAEGKRGKPITSEVMEKNIKEQFKQYLTLSGGVWDEDLDKLFTGKSAEQLSAICYASFAPEKMRNEVLNQSKELNKNGLVNRVQDERVLSAFSNAILGDENRRKIAQEMYNHLQSGDWKNKDKFWFMKWYRAGKNMVGGPLLLILLQSIDGTLDPEGIKAMAEQEAHRPAQG